MSFDHLAPVYSTLERFIFGNALQRARTAFIPELSQSRSALSIGGGDGRFLAALLAANVEIHVTAVERSTKMIQRARRRIRDAARVEFIHSDIEHAPLDRTYDAIATNFFLDCFTEEELTPIVQKVAARAEPQAIWTIGEFTGAPRGKLLVAFMYAFFRLTTRISASRLPDYARLLQRHGFRREKRHLFYGGVVCAELWKRS